MDLSIIEDLFVEAIPHTYGKNNESFDEIHLSLNHILIAAYLKTEILRFKD